MSTDRQRQIERSRDRVMSIREDEALRHQQRRHHMDTTRRTEWGDRVAKWPDASTLLTRIEHVNEAMRTLYEEAEKCLMADRSMANQTSLSADRFPALGGQ